MKKIILTAVAATVALAAHPAAAAEWVELIRDDGDGVSFVIDLSRIRRQNAIVSIPTKMIENGIPGRYELDYVVNCKRNIWTISNGDGREDWQTASSLAAIPGGHLLCPPKRVSLPYDGDRYGI